MPPGGYGAAGYLCLSVPGCRPHPHGRQPATDNTVYHQCAGHPWHDTRYFARRGYPGCVFLVPRLRWHGQSVTVLPKIYDRLNLGVVPLDAR